MKLYQRITAGILVVAGLAGLFGCNKNNDSDIPETRTLKRMAAQSIRKIDLYNNGEESIVAAYKTGWGGSGIYLFKREGNSFQDGVQLTAEPSKALEVMDINGDQFPDIVYGFDTGYGGTGIKFLINNQDGTFSPRK